MVTKYVNQPLGMGQSFAPSRKEWVTAALAGGSLALGLGSSLFGGISSSKAAREAEKRLQEQKAKEEAYYRRRYNEDYLDTNAGQNLVRRAKDFAKENWRKASGAQAVAGGTDAATAQAKEAGNKMMGDTIANIAAADVQRKDNIDAQHMQAQDRYAQQEMAISQQRAQSTADAAAQASNALMSAAGTLAGGTEKNLQGGSNNSKPVPQQQNNVTTTPNKVSVTTPNEHFGGGVDKTQWDKLMGIVK